MKLPVEGIVDVAKLSRIYGNTVATYKFYWFISIINHLVANPEKRLFSFEEIIAGMIAEVRLSLHYYRTLFLQTILSVNHTIVLTIKHNNNG